MPDLCELDLLAARANNNKDQIVGCARTENVPAIQHAFLLEPVTPDFNHDDTVSSADLAHLLVQWSSDDPYTDLNGDGAVNGADLALLLANWAPIPERKPYDWIP